MEQRQLAGLISAKADVGSSPAGELPLLLRKADLITSRLFFLQSISMYYVYILYSEQFDKTYIGYSYDPQQRLLSHNELSPKGWTKRYRPWK
ncbi:GIY-YIG nuclease family protein, partial [Arthrospira platensis SPKY1]|nr:GIY-YIG nuclease family protein [Arthrospira platensis SPKY1]